MKYLRAFAFFWWDFVVGDSITLAVGTVTALFGAFLLAGAGAGASAEVVLPAGVLLTLVIALRR